MSTSATQLAPPGWYRDPSGTGRRRWWNGLAWTDYMDDDLVMQGAVHGAVIQPMIPSSTSLNPWPIWALAVLPLASLVPLLLTDYGQLFREVFRAYMAGASTQSVQLGLLPLSLLNYAFGLGVYVLAVVLSYLDHRMLSGRVGVVRPFHWAWSFLLPLVYFIGRAVVLRRRTGQSARGPVWMYVLISIVVGFAPAIRITAAMSEVFPQIVQEIQQQQIQLPNDNLDA